MGWGGGAGSIGPLGHFDSEWDRKPLDSSD